MQEKKISVMGCGWLGWPLAEKLIQLGYQVNGSTTTPAKIALLQAAGIEPFLLSFPENSPENTLANFLSADILVFNLPPSRSASKAMAYEQILQKVLAAAPAQLKNIIFVSSTSVYPELNREVFENDALASPTAANLLLRCEYLVQKARPGKTSIVRLSGLMGGNRHPGRFMAGKTQVANPEAPVNMIHRVDAVNLLAALITQQTWGRTFNSCAPVHPTKKEFYTQASHQLNLEPPNFFDEGTPSFKIVNSQLIQEELQYTFTFPDPVACLASPDF